MSGFLSAEDFDKADELIRETMPIDSDGDGFIGEPVEAKAETEPDDVDEPSENLEEDVKTDGEDTGEEEHTQGHRVPYNRFKSVLDARNEYKGEIETLRERNRELEVYLASKPSAPEHSEEDTELYGGDLGYEDEYGNSLDSGFDDKRVKDLESQMHDLRVQHHKQQLVRDMGTIKEKFPNVPPESILQAVANDPNIDVFQVAETFNSFLAEREEAAIQRYLKENPEAAALAAPKAAPRPRSSGSGESPGSSRVPKDKRPRQMKDVRNALLNYVKENNIF
jgi:hypothetical protein